MGNCFCFCWFFVDCNKGIENIMNKQHIEFVWQYKDSFRFWWEIKMCKDVEEKIDEERNAHWGWNYEIEKDNVKIHFGFIRGQYDIPPSLNDILLDFSSYISSVVIGAAKHGNLKE